LAECEAAVGLLNCAGDRARLADALVVLGRLRFWAGERPADAETLESAVELARTTHNRAAELLALESLALLHVNLREPTDRAIAKLERLLGAAHGAPRAEAGILTSLAWLYQYAGRLDDARATLGRSRDMFERFGAIGEWAAGARTAAAIDLLAGDPVAAERALLDAYDRLQQAEQAIRASIMGWLADVFYIEGRHDEAEDAAVKARELTPKDDREVHVRACAVQAKVRARGRKQGAAERLLRTAATYLVPTPPSRPPAEFWTITLPVSGTTSPTLVGTLLLARGEVLQLLGKPEQAAEAYRAAHNLYRDKCAWPLAERARHLAAETAHVRAGNGRHRGSRPPRPPHRP
jgi:tetratricopeptide (TPR) repeat protein